MKKKKVTKKSAAAVAKKVLDERKLDPMNLGIPNINFSVHDLDKKKRIKKFKKQRLERGFDDSETWNLSATILEFTLPRLKVLIDLINGYPPELTEEEWKVILEKIVNAIESILEDNYAFETEYKISMQNEGMDLFFKYFFDLWW